ncbi:MAG: uL15 family ribosomal protein [Candidatus Marsarchaeota archaeon]|nr:uL15 family ribosomal protein [Candidatus Marsarchaeota archaeon]
MVVRSKKQSRKYLGRRSWGAGNIKNRRGKGSRGGVGKGGRKHKFTRAVITGEGLLGKKGFTNWNSSRLKETSIGALSAMAAGHDGKTIELKGYKVLSSGALDRALSVRASAFSKKAVDKIKQAGGEAITI